MPPADSIHPPWHQRIVEVHPGEGPRLWGAFVYFFLLLTGYYVLRPLREEMGIAGGVHAIPSMMAITFAVTLLLNPLWAALVSRVPRRRLLPWVYRFFIANLLLFFIGFRVSGGAPLLARAFYSWVSVFNLFAVAVFWSFMADLFRPDQGKRLFGFIAAGGSLGAVCGPLLTTALVEQIGPINLLLVAAAMIEGAAQAATRLGRTPGFEADAASNQPVGGTAWEGFRAVLQSPYLLGAALYVFLATVTGTVGYMVFLRSIAATDLDSVGRTRLFASADLWANVVTGLSQSLLIGRVVKRMGLSVTLSVLPLIAAVTLAATAISPTIGILVIVHVLRRTAAYGIASPAQAMLFTVVSRQDKYKAKAFIDTAIYRTGDVLGANAFGGLLAAGLSTGGIAWITAALCAPWMALGIALGKRWKQAAVSPPC